VPVIGGCAQAVPASSQHQARNQRRQPEDGPRMTCRSFQLSPLSVVPPRGQDFRSFAAAQKTATAFRKTARLSADGRAGGKLRARGNPRQRLPVASERHRAHAMHHARRGRPRPRPDGGGQPRRASTPRSCASSSSPRSAGQGSPTSRSTLTRSSMRNRLAPRSLALK
jgi:hypothetical protein